MTTTEITKYDCATIRRQLATELRVDIDRIRVRQRGDSLDVWLQGEMQYLGHRSDDIPVDAIAGAFHYAVAAFVKRASVDEIRNLDIGTHWRGRIIQELELTFCSKCHGPVTIRHPYKYKDDGDLEVRICCDNILCRFEGRALHPPLPKLPPCDDDVIDAEFEDVCGAPCHDGKHWCNLASGHGGDDHREEFPGGGCIGWWREPEPKCRKGTCKNRAKKDYIFCQECIDEGRPGDDQAEAGIPPRERAECTGCGAVFNFRETKHVCGAAVQVGQRWAPQLGLGEYVVWSIQADEGTVMLARRSGIATRVTQRDLLGHRWAHQGHAECAKDDCVAPATRRGTRIGDVVCEEHIERCSVCRKELVGRRALSQRRCGGCRTRDVEEQSHGTLVDEKLQAVAGVRDKELVADVGKQWVIARKGPEPGNLRYNESSDRLEYSVAAGGWASVDGPVVPQRARLQPPLGSGKPVAREAEEERARGLASRVLVYIDGVLAFGCDTASVDGESLVCPHIQHIDESWREGIKTVTQLSHVRIINARNIAPWRDGDYLVENSSTHFWFHRSAKP